MNLTKDKSAQKLLYLMLSVVVIFVTIVCLVINDRNNKIISGATIGETDKVQKEQVTEQLSEKETEFIVKLRCASAEIQQAVWAVLKSAEDQNK